MRCKPKVVFVHVCKGGYYSNPTVKYLTYNNTLNSSVQQQLESLKCALAIGRILRRIVIMPKFHCTEKLRDYGCPLNYLISIADFDWQFGRKYRESSFLRHPRVPDSVRQSQTAAGEIQVSRRLLNLMPQAREFRLTSDEVLKLLGGYHESVLKLEPLTDIRVIFLSNEETFNFEEMIAMAFKRSNYRRLNFENV